MNRTRKVGVEMKFKAIETRHGIIFSRNAMIICSHELTLAPITLTVTASLSLRGCKPRIANMPEVRITFTFTDIEQLSIYRLDDYPNEKYTDSCFDLVEGTYKRNRKRIVLSTYDHVFDVIGQCEVSYA